MNDSLEFGKLLMVGLPGPTFDIGTRELMVKYGVSHFILFRRNIESPAQVTDLCQQLRDYAFSLGLDEPIIAIDQEGGTVSRLGLPFRQFKDARVYGEAENNEELLMDYVRQCSADLKMIGVNLNFAPVLDVCPSGKNCFMEKRVLGGDPVEVARLGALVVKEFQGRGIAACGKHFPGLGEAVIDPHRHLPVVDDDLAKIKAVDLEPFRAAIAAGLATIMTSHVIYNHLAPGQIATLSKEILTDLLRGELGFQGLLVTDDLEMGAIANEVAIPEAAYLALEAGADMLLICSDQQLVAETVDLLVEKYEVGDLAKPRVDEALERIESVSRAFGRG